MAWRNKLISTSQPEGAIIVFGRYAKAGNGYYSIPEKTEDLLQILEFEKSVNYRNVHLVDINKIINNMIKECNYYLKNYKKANPDDKATEGSIKTLEELKKRISEALK